MKRLMRGELAKQSGVNSTTVRYYEKIGLLSEPPRSNAGYRMFSTKNIERIRFIKQAQELGFSLDEIKELLGSGSAKECRAVRDLLQQKIFEVDEQIKKMKSFKKTLSSHLKACDDELNQKGQNANCPAFFEIKRGNK